MEVTKKVGDPDLSDPQGHPSAGSQQLGGILRESRGPWANSGSVYFGQGLSLSPEAITAGACSPASWAYAAEPVPQPPWAPAKVSAQCDHEQASQDVLRLTPTGRFPNPIVDAQVQFIMEKETLPLSLCMCRNCSNGMVQHGSSSSWLQVQGVREGKSPAKVLLGWGKGPCSLDWKAPLGIRVSQQVPYFLSAENGSTAAQGSFLAPAQDQGQGKCPCPAQGPPTAAQANTPALNTSPMPIAVERYTCNPDHLTNNIAVTKDLDRDVLKKCGSQWSDFMEATSCQDKVSFGSQKLPTPGPTLKESPERGLELTVARSQVFPMQPENPAEKPLTFTLTPGSWPAVLGMLGTPKSQRSGQEILSSQPEKQPLNVGHNTRSRVPLSAYPVTCLKQGPVQSPQEAMQMPSSSAPPRQPWGAVEDHVLVLDMTTGHTRTGLLYHDPMGSRAVLVGLTPNYPSIHAPENMPPTQPPAVPIISPDSTRASFWPTASVLSTPVPSSLSSGSYREVALVSKESRPDLQLWDSPGADTPLSVGMLPGPVPLGMPLQFGERTLSTVHHPGGSKPGVEKNEPSRTIWTLDASGMQDVSMGQAQKRQLMNSGMTPEPAPSANPQEAPHPLLQEDPGSHTQEEVNTARPGNPRAEGTRQAPVKDWPPLAEQHPLTGQPPLAGQTPLSRQLFLAEQPPSTKQAHFPGLPPLTGTPVVKQCSLTGQPPLSQEPTTSKEPILSRGVPTTREAGQASTQYQEGEAVGLPTHVGVLRVPLAQRKNCVCVSGEQVGIGAPPSFNTHWLSYWQPGSSPWAPGEQLSLITFAPGAGSQVLPMAMVGTVPEGPRLKLTAEDIGLLSGTCYAVPGPSPALGPYQKSAAVVIDTGTGFTKCGLAGEDHILSVVPSRVQLLQQPAQDRPRYVMPEDRGGSHTVLHRGVVSDWDALEVLWQHLFYCKLGMKPEELAVLVADSPISPRTNREKVAEILFECFHVPAMQTVHQALLALYAYGRTTGLVLGSGHGISYVAPIVTGDLAPLDTYRLDVAGADLTEHLAELLQAGGHSPPQEGLVNHIKETCCYVSLNMEAEMAHSQAQARVDFVLPDKQVISLGSERFCCPEALFQPNLLGLDQPGLPQLALLSISRLEAKQQEQLLANVVLDGGSTLVNGFPERLKKELGPRATVLGSSHRAVAAWLGGSIMASRDSFQSLWLSRREYDEEGPWAIYKYHL